MLGVSLAQRSIGALEFLKKGIDILSARGKRFKRGHKNRQPLTVVYYTTGLGNGRGSGSRQHGLLHGCLLLLIGLPFHQV